MRWFVAAVGARDRCCSSSAIVTGWGLQANETTPLNDLVFFVFFTVLAIGLPGACAIAILRYRLYELDLVVKKTVLYAVVALVLVAIFFVFAVLVGAGVHRGEPARDPGVDRDRPPVLARRAAGAPDRRSRRLRRTGDARTRCSRSSPSASAVPTPPRTSFPGWRRSSPTPSALARPSCGCTWGTELRPSGIAPPEGEQPTAVSLRGDDDPAALGATRPSRFATRASSSARCRSRCRRTTRSIRRRSGSCATSPPRRAWCCGTSD